jgi:methyl-accepting chemotaxis protein
LTGRTLQVKISRPLYNIIYVIAFPVYEVYCFVFQVYWVQNNGGVSMSIRNQILFPIIFVALLLVGSALGVSINQFSSYVNQSILSETNKALKGLADEIESKKQDALSKGLLASSYPGLATAISANDSNTVLLLMTPIMNNSKLDFLTVTDARGVVIARVHQPTKKGDNLANQANIVGAMKGTAAAFVEPGTEIKISTRAGVPVKNAAGSVVGIVSVGYKLDEMSIVDQAKKIFGADFTIFLGDVRISTTVEQDGKRVIGTKLDPAIAKTVLTDGQEFHGRATILNQPYLTAYMPVTGPDNKPIGVLFAGQSVKVAEDAISRTQLFIAGICLILLLLSLIAMFFVVRRITVPLGMAVNDLAQLGAGNFTLTVPPAMLRRKDEIGKLAMAINSLTQNMRGLLKQIAQSSEHVAASSEELTASAQQSAEASTTIAQSIQQVARGSEQQVSAVNDTSAIVEEIAATMQEVSATADEMAKLSSQTAQAALEGKSSIDSAVNQMSAVNTGSTQAQIAAEKLKSSSAQIGEIVSLISTIAGQTNLLALNAAIEAARAGEAGRGFAVVADEVRKLAEQSETAAHQIKNLVDQNHGSIDNVVGAIDLALKDVAQGVALVNVAGNNFAAINSQISLVTEQVASIANAVHEAAVGSGRIVSAIKEVENLSRDAAAESQNVAAATEEQSASMEEIAASSQALAKLAEDLQAAVAKFTI